MLVFLKALSLVLSDKIISNIIIYADDTTLYFKDDLGFDLWHLLELAWPD